jgi:hypothetical protein
MAPRRPETQPCKHDVDARRPFAAPLPDQDVDDTSDAQPDHEVPSIETDADADANDCDGSIDEAPDACIANVVQPSNGVHIESTDSWFCM